MEFIPYLVSEHIMVQVQYIMVCIYTHVLIFRTADILCYEKIIAFDN